MTSIGLNRLGVVCRGMVCELVSAPVHARARSRAASMCLHVIVCACDPALEPRRDLSRLSWSVHKCVWVRVGHYVPVRIRVQIMESCERLPPYVLPCRNARDGVYMHGDRASEFPCLPEARVRCDSCDVPVQRKTIKKTIRGTSLNYMLIFSIASETSESDLNYEPCHMNHKMIHTTKLRVKSVKVKQIKLKHEIKTMTSSTVESECNNGHIRLRVKPCGTMPRRAPR